MKFADTKAKRFLLLAISGLLTGFTLVFPKVGIIEWLTLAPLALFFFGTANDEKLKPRHFYGYGFFYFMCFYIVNFHWFVNLYPLSFIDGMTKGLATVVVLVAWFGLSMFQAVGGGVAFLIIALLFRTPIVKKYSFSRPFFAAGTYAVYEWTQTIGWWGVPWGRLPIGQSELIVGLQTASLFGSYFITFAIVLVNFLVAYAIFSFFSDEKERAKKNIRASAVAALAVLLFQYGAGTVIWFSNTPNKEKEDTVVIAAIQGNIPSGEKWDSNSTQKTKEVYRKYTLKAKAEGADIVVWPETAIPYTVAEGNSIYLYISELAKEADVTILAGVFTREGADLYNSIVCFTPDGKMEDTVYSKRRLVPFGEFVPMRGLVKILVPPLAELVMSDGDIVAGEDSRIFDLKEGNFGSIICFDSIYEELTLDAVRDGAELICLSTNDSWFTDSAALYMHNAQAQLRSIECGRYTIRAANTGISTAISNRGEVIEELDPLVDGMVCEELSLKNNRTLYSYIGNTFVYVCIVIIAAVICHSAAIGFRKKRKIDENT